jgi:hypothetical protein
VKKTRKQEFKAFSSEVETGSREENAPEQNPGQGLIQLKSASGFLSTKIAMDFGR